MYSLPQKQSLLNEECRTLAKYLIFSDPGARVQMETSLPYIQIFGSYKSRQQAKQKCRILLPWQIDFLQHLEVQVQIQNSLTPRSLNCCNMAVKWESCASSHPTPNFQPFFLFSSLLLDSSAMCLQLLPLYCTPVISAIWCHLFGSALWLLSLTPISASD